MAQSLKSKGAPVIRFLENNLSWGGGNKNGVDRRRGEEKGGIAKGRRYLKKIRDEVASEQVGGSIVQALLGAWDEKVGPIKKKD